MKKNPNPYKFAVVATVAAASLWLTGGQIATVQAADHRDSPTMNEDPRADLLDVYAFVNPNNTNNVVLGLTVNPAAVAGLLGITFSPDILYQFKIDNTGDYKEDLVIQATFSEPVPGPQQMTIIGPGKPSSTTIVNSVLNTRKVGNFTGPSNGTIVTNGTGNIRAFAGLTDDPFFIDLIWVFRLLGIVPGGPITNRPPGIDFYKAINCSTLAIEVPAALLRGSVASNNTIHVWATTSRSTITMRSTKLTRLDKNSKKYTQVDREGKPALNTVLIPGTRKDEYNRAVPSQDRALFRAQAIASLTGVNGDTNYSATVADILLPDVLTLDMTSLAPYLNGRAPQDDFLDLTLNVASKGAVLTDNVDANDVPFRADFPFFAPAHPPEEPIPGRN